MASQDLLEIMKRVESLSLDEQLQLMAYLADRSRRAEQGTKRARDWQEIRGAAPYPLVGEDAQRWVSRTRREGDEARERGLHRQP